MAHDVVIKNGTVIDGSGSADDTAEAEAEKWGAGIVADAAKFKPSRK